MVAGPVAAPADPEAAVAVQTGRTLALLEDFCSGPDFTSALQGFIEEHCGAFEEVEEHPLEWYETYRKYCAVVEGQLQAFLDQTGLGSDHLLDLCEHVRDCGN